MPADSLNIPIIETERLRLRGHRPEDFEASAAMWADPRVTRYITGRPSTQEESWGRLLRYAGHWSHLGFGYWAVEEKITGVFAGELGFSDYKREIEPAIKDVPELGWVLAPDMHGKGYATEAVRAALVWGDSHFASARSLCLIAPENAPSIRVAEKCGYRELLRTTYKGDLTILFERGRLD
jgi:RimJ/RimL family protein N-acetyltransferase